MEVTRQTVVCCDAMLCSLVKEYKYFRETTATIIREVSWRMHVPLER